MPTHPIVHFHSHTMNFDITNGESGEDRMFAPIG